MGVSSANPLPEAAIPESGDIPEAYRKRRYTGSGCILEYATMSHLRHRPVAAIGALEEVGYDDSSHLWFHECYSDPLPQPPDITLCKSQCTRRVGVSRQLIIPGYATGVLSRRYKAERRNTSYEMGIIR